MVILLPVLLFSAYIGRLWTVPVGVACWIGPALASGRLPAEGLPDAAAAIAFVCLCGVGMHHFMKLVAPGFARA